MSALFSKQYKELRTELGEKRFKYKINQKKRLTSADKRFKRMVNRGVNAADAWFRAYDANFDQREFTLRAKVENRTKWWQREKTPKSIGELLLAELELKKYLDTANEAC